MGKLFLFAMLALSFPAIAAKSVCAPTQYDETVVFKAVIDGDTIQLKDDRRVRLIGIDSPEIDLDYPELSEPFAKQARDFLSQYLTKGQTLFLAFDRKRLDPQGKTLAYVYTQDDEHLQEVILSHGYAKARVYQNDYFWQCLANIEQRARTAKLGLWAHPSYQAKTLAALNRDDRNRWREVRGVVTGFERKGQHLWLIVDKNFYVGIPSEESGNFSNILSLDLLESRVIVRGELYYSYKKWQMIAYHPSQISLQNEP